MVKAGRVALVDPEAKGVADLLGRVRADREAKAGPVVLEVRVDKAAAVLAVARVVPAGPVDREVPVAKAVDLVGKAVDLVVVAVAMVDSSPSRLRRNRSA